MDADSPEVPTIGGDAARGLILYARQCQLCWRERFLDPAEIVARWPWMAERLALETPSFFMCLHCKTYSFRHFRSATKGVRKPSR